ncbi:MAG: hypothetical protein PHU46_18120 [Rhodocyclaceae bacterium]|nr:hypothetical protein [Rhodocyclaceae bacterium]
MHSLKFLPGPRLMVRWYPMPDWAEVSERAHQFLFEDIEMDAAATLADVFGLMRVCPPLRDVFGVNFAHELFAEAEKGPLPARDEERKDAIEYLELYSQWHFNSATKTYGSVHKLSLHGVGPLLVEDAPDYGKKAGERIQWSVSTTPLRKLLALPVRVNPSVSVYEDDLDARAYGAELYQVALEAVTLGQILHGLVGELSFHGAPSEVEEFVASLKKEMEEIDAGTAPLISGDDLFDGMNRPACEALFDNIGSYPVAEISRAVREIEDNDNVVEALARALGEGVVVKPPYRDLTGRSFRTAFRDASGDLLDQAIPPA